ncbi:hypothetical protein TSUD_262610 [Trifolium subterraneum]|nr:hypothetical protein TSUD_262610 [Trifolium subterraneum]
MIATEVGSLLNDKTTKLKTRREPKSHLLDYWFCIRKVNGEWCNFGSLYVTPQRLTKSYLATRLNSLKGPEWSIFAVRGNFPTVFPISSSEDSTSFGKWLSPEDAERINNSCNATQY